MISQRVVAVTMTLAIVSVVSAPSPPARAAEGYVTFGGQWWTQSANDAKFQEFREVPLGALIENFLLQEWSGRNTLSLWGANSIRSDQATRLTLANGARWRADIGYAEIPHAFSFIARSAWAEQVPGNYGLSDSIQAANQRTPANYTNNMKELLNNSPTIPLEFRTDISSLRLRARPAREWQFEARGARRERSGQKAYGMSFGFNTALENPEPIDQTVYDADLIGSYRHKSLTAQLVAGTTIFENNVSTLFVDNPKRLTDQVGGDGAKVGALDLYPDNRQLRGTLAVGYRMANRTALAATLGLSQVQQDDGFLPFTNNKALGPSNPDSLPAKNADAKAFQINGDLRLTTHPLNGLDGAVRFHYTDYDNQTSEVQLNVRIPYDASVQRFGQTGPDDHTNHAFSNTQWHVGVDADYAVAPRVKVGGTYEYRMRERTEREVEKDNESVIGARLHVGVLPELSVDANYTHGDRQLDEFLEEDYFGLRTRFAGGTNPAVFDSVGQLEQLELRRYDVANRVQDRAVAGVSYTLGALDLSVGYTYLDNDYKDTTLGLLSEIEHNVTVGGTYHVGERLDLDGAYGYGQLETDQNSRQSGSSIPSTNPLDNWSADLKDTDVYVGAGVSWRPPVEKLSFLATYQFSRHFQEFDLSNAANTAQDLPSTIYRLHDVVVDTRYRWLRNLTLTGRYAWEQYDTNDWATTNVPFIFPTTGTSNAIYLGDSSQSYRAHRIALLATFSF